MLSTLVLLVTDSPQLRSRLGSKDVEGTNVCLFAQCALFGIYPVIIECIFLLLG